MKINDGFSTDGIPRYATYAEQCWSNPILFFISKWSCSWTPTWTDFIFAEYTIVSYLVISYNKRTTKYGTVVILEN